MLRQICNDNCCSLFAEYHLIYNIIETQKGYTLKTDILFIEIFSNLLKNLGKLYFE